MISGMKLAVQLAPSIPGRGLDWITLSSPSPCEAPTWAGKSDGDSPVSPSGAVMSRGKEST